MSDPEFQTTWTCPTSARRRRRPRRRRHRTPAHACGTSTSASSTRSRSRSSAVASSRGCRSCASTWPPVSARSAFSADERRRARRTARRSVTITVDRRQQPRTAGDRRRLPHPDPAGRRQGRAGDRARARTAARRGGRRGRGRARADGERDRARARRRRSRSGRRSARRCTHAVAHWPDHDFVVTPDRRMTYAQAEEESRRLAKRMLAAGMGKGTRVGLYFPYGQDWVVAWLAASRIGALVMPLATTYRPAEIRKVLRIGDIDTLLTARVGARSRHAGHARSERARPRRRRRPAALPPRRALAARGLDHRRRSTARGRRRSTSTRPPPMPRSPTTCCARSKPRWCRPTSRRSPTRRDRAPIRRASCTRTAPSCGRRPRLAALADRRRHAAAVLLRVPVLLDRRHAHPRRRAAERARRCSCIERFDPGAALDLIEAAQATHVLGWPTLLQSMRDIRRSPAATLPAIPGLTVGPADVALVGGPGTRHPRAPRHERDRRQHRSVGHRVVDPDTGRRRGRRRGRASCWVRGYGLMHGYYKQERADVFDDDGWLHTGDRVFLHDGPPVVRRSLHRDGEVARRQRRAPRGRAVPRGGVRRGALRVRARHCRIPSSASR